MNNDRSAAPIGFFRLFLAAALLIACVAFIWSNSLQDAFQSGLRSQKMADFLVGVLGNVLPKGHWVLEYVRTHVRKIAHAVEFFALGTGAMVFFMVLRRVNISTILHAILLVLAVAVIDETIQSYTGRGDSVRDVVLDFCGGLAGVVVVGIGSFITRAGWGKG